MINRVWSALLITKEAVVTIAVNLAMGWNRFLFDTSLSKDEYRKKAEALLKGSHDVLIFFVTHDANANSLTFATKPYYNYCLSPIGT